MQLALTRHPRSVDERAVHRAEIDDEPDSLLAEQRRVRRRHGVVPDAHVVLLRTPDRADGTLHLKARAGELPPHDLETRGGRTVRGRAGLLLRDAACDVREIQLR